MYDAVGPECILAGLTRCEGIIIKERDRLTCEDYAEDYPKHRCCERVDNALEDGHNEDPQPQW